MHKPDNKNLESAAFFTEPVKGTLPPRELVYFCATSLSLFCTASHSASGIMRNSGFITVTKSSFFIVVLEPDLYAFCLFPYVIIPMYFSL